MLPLVLFKLLELAVLTAGTHLSLEDLFAISVSSKLLSPGGFVTHLFPQHFQLVHPVCQLLGIAPEASTSPLFVPHLSQEQGTQLSTGDCTGTRSIRGAESVLAVDAFINKV